MRAVLDRGALHSSGVRSMLSVEVPVIVVLELAV